MFIKTASFVFRLVGIFLLTTLLFSTQRVIPAQAAGILYAKPGGIGNCSSWANSCSLQTALTRASSGNEIWVAAGTHKPTTGTDRTATFQLKVGVAVYGGFIGRETARDQRNYAANVTSLSGDLSANDNSIVTWEEPTRADNSYHVVTGADTAVLDGFTVTAGNANGNDPNYDGAGMYNTSGSNATLTNVIFIYNSANNNGGGMYNSSSSPTLTNVIFRGNSAQAGGGMVNSSGNPTLTNVTFDQNGVHFGGAVGGGLLNSYGNPILTNVIFSNNSSGNVAGGMFNSYGNPTLTNVIFYGNYANHYGGGINNGNGNPILVNVAFTGNVSTFKGGGMFNNSSSPILTNVTFSGNASSEGGGIYNLNSNTTLTNVTFNGNNGDTGGGGLYENASASILTNVTFSGNSTSYHGGGIYNELGSSTQIRNTIFWGNTAGTAGAQIYNDASSPVVNDSVVQDGCPAGITCTDIITANPVLGTLGTYGGFTQTIPLLPGSSAIDTGDNATCADTDQRGMSRPFSPIGSEPALCDIGAFEAANQTTHGSVAANDGWTLESSEYSSRANQRNNSGLLLLGDDAKNKQYRSLLYFDTASLPNNATILNATLRIKQADFAEGINPFSTHLTLLAEMKNGFFGKSLLENTDFQAPANPKRSIGNFNAVSGEPGWYELVLNPANFKYVNLNGVTQFRLRFTKDDDNDKVADIISFYSGDDATNPPQLIVEYITP